MNYRQMMIADGAPKGLFLTQAQRAKAWAGRPLTTVPLFQSTPKSETVETAAFRAQVEEDRRLKSLAGIQRMKNRFAAKAVDYSKMRWDARRAKFVPIIGDLHVPTSDQGVARLSNRPAQIEPAASPHGRLRVVSQTVDVAGQDWSRVDKTTAETLARLNSVWKPEYTKLSGGLLVMTIRNRLKGIVKKGGTVSWS